MCCCLLIAVAGSIGNKTKVFLLLGRPPVMHSLCEVVGQAAPTQLPPAAGNFPELHVAPLPVQGRLLTEETSVCALMKFLRYGRRVLKPEVSGEQRVPGGGS